MKPIIKRENHDIETFGTPNTSRSAHPLTYVAQFKTRLTALVPMLRLKYRGSYPRCVMCNRYIEGWARRWCTDDKNSRLVLCGDCYDEAVTYLEKLADVELWRQRTEVLIKSWKEGKL